MRYIPRELLRRLMALPDKVPLRILLHTNGYGEWKTEPVIIQGSCGQGETIDLEALLHEEQGHE